jgi:hypothetical protein
MNRAWRWWAVGMLVGCGPQFIESSDEIDAFLARGNHAYACVAFRSDEARLRTYAATRLAKFPEVADATECVCAALYNADQGTWDPAVAEGLAGSRRDDLAACLQPAASDARIKDRGALVEALGALMAPAGWDSLASMVATETDEAVRVAAVHALRSSHAHTEALLKLATSEPSDAVRAAAVRALDGHEIKAIESTVIAKANEDTAEAVRLAAVEVLADNHNQAVDEMLCSVMLNDSSPAVRAAAVKSFSGTKSKRGVECLRQRLLKLDEDAGSRQALLDALQASPREDASAALCDGIGPWVRMYIKDRDVGKVGGADIVEAQNNNHWEASFDCVSKALAQGGYTCYARNYLAHWSKQLGGSITPPWCPGMARK